MTSRISLFSGAAVTASLALALALLIFPIHDLAVKSGTAESRPKQTASVGTPVAPPSDDEESTADEATPADDPLDGDPLDGKPRDDDLDAPSGETRLAIARSGRPDNAPRSVVAYDDDPSTVWSPEPGGGDSWLWLDLGDVRRVREVRWLARGSGTIELSISSDRRRWESVDAVDARRDWQEIALRDDARYVRLELSPAEDGTLPEIAEVAVYGREVDSGATLAQKAKDSENRKDRKQKDNKNSGSKSDSQKKGKGEKSSGGKNAKDKTSSAGGNITAQQGDTDCNGNHERCRTREGTVSVEDDCESEGTCTIDVQADGGSSTCDATGGAETKAGRGKGKHGGEGGRCEAVADGGAVTIGDINP